MSDKDYKGKKGVDGDDYKPLKFYKTRISGVENGFDEFSEGDEHYFTYNLDGEVILISEGYTSTKGRDKGMASVEKNRFVEARYKRDVFGSDKHFFNLIAGNHQEIATSAWFTSAAAMETAIARLMGQEAGALAAGSIVGSAVAAVVASVAPEPVEAAPAPVQASSIQAPLGSFDGGPDNSSGGSSDESPEESSEDSPEEEEKSPSVLWWLLPVLIALLVWFLFYQCCNKPVGLDEASLSPAPVAKLAPTAPVQAEAEKAPEPVLTETVTDTLETAAENLGEFFASTLPDGVELTIPEKGVENKLLAFIRDDSRPVDKTTWFDFDRIYFDSGKAELKTESREQIANIAQILLAYPNVKLKVGGYTDNTGSESFNQALSERRADTVKNALISQGLMQERIVSEGYGSQHPVASNETEEGRKKNRRISLRVTEK